MTRTHPVSLASPAVKHGNARRILVALVGAAAIATIAIGVADLPTGTGGSAAAPFSRARVSALLAGSPAPLAALHAQAGELLGGGAAALHARLTALRGYPVVIDKWASWCGPCRAELPLLQRVSAEYGRRVAFVGIDSEDPNRAQAMALLRSVPLSYPSYYDESGALGEQVTDSSGTPVTVFVPRGGGRPFIYQGQFPSAAKLSEDVQRYALDG